MFAISKRWSMVLLGLLAPASGAQISTTPLTFSGDDHGGHDLRRRSRLR